MSSQFECGTCGKGFPAGWRARDNHLRSTGHCSPTFECDTCCRYFNSESARHQHMNDCNHFSWKCHFCDETWPSESRRTVHEREEHFWCGECERRFQSYNNLKMHLNSRVHQNFNIACPFCKQSYQTATGLAYHIESGSCPSTTGVNRDTLYKVIRSKDPSGVITKNLIGWTGGTQYEANERAYNYRCEAWECYLCHRLFNSLSALNQHLASPTHQEKYYHCPNRSCRAEFTTIAGFFNHLESESCGFMRFDNVQRSIQGIVGGDRLIGF